MSNNIAHIYFLDLLLYKKSLLVDEILPSVFIIYLGILLDGKKIICLTPGTRLPAVSNYSPTLSVLFSWLNEQHNFIQSDISCIWISDFWQLSIKCVTCAAVHPNQSTHLCSCGVKLWHPSMICCLSQPRSQMSASCLSRTLHTCYPALLGWHLVFPSSVEHFTWVSHRVSPQLAKNHSGGILVRCLKHLSWLLSGWKSSHSTLSSSQPWSDRVPHPISKGEPKHRSEEAHFHWLYLPSHSFNSYWKLWP